MDRVSGPNAGGVRLVEASPDFIADPWSEYERLRASGPVCRLRLPVGLALWLVLDETLGKEVLTDYEVFSRAIEGVWAAAERQGVPSGSEQEAKIRANMLNADPPAHTRLRSPLAEALAPRTIRALRPDVQKIVDDLIDQLRPDRVVDLVSKFALPLPLTVICSLLGVPVADRQWLRENAAVAASAGSILDHDLLRNARESLAGYFRGLAASGGKAPLLAPLIQAQRLGELSETEVVSTISLLVIAGHETTAHWIARSLAIIASEDPIKARVKANLPKFLDEVLRYEPPAHFSMLRHTTREVILGGVTIPQGEVVAVALGAANRAQGEASTEHATRAPGGGLSFGHGTHFCLGAGLARLEAEVAVESLLRAYPGVRLVEPPEEGSGLFFRGPATVRVRLIDEQEYVSQ